MSGAQEEHGEGGVEAERREDKVSEVRLLSKVKRRFLRKVASTFSACEMKGKGGFTLC